MASEIEIKTERLMRLADSQGLDGILLNGQHNFAWITGGASNGIDQTRDNGAASVLVAKDGRRILLASNIEMPRLQSEVVSANDFVPMEFPWQDERSSSRFLISQAIYALGDGQIATDIPIDASAPAIEGLITRCRYSLTADEKVRFRDLGRDAGQAMRNVVDRIKPGETEIEIAGAIRSELEKANITAPVVLVAVDDRMKKYRHPVPTANKWEKTAMLVACVRRGGLTASLSRIVSVGAATREMRERTNAAAFVNASLWNATREGTSGRDLYEVAANAYAEAEFADEINKHHQGGAAGYRTREWVAHPECNETVQPDQAFAWNPSIAGTKVEETVILENNFVQAITTSPDFPSIVHEIDGIEYSSPGILEI
jgi:Xaa-Pro dipeptidase